MFHRNCSSLSTDWTQGSCLVSDVKTRRLTIYNPTITPLLKCFCSWFDIILFVNILFLFNTATDQNSGQYTRWKEIFWQNYFHFIWNKKICIFSFQANFTILHLALVNLRLVLGAGSKMRSSCYWMQICPLYQLRPSTRELYRTAKTGSVFEDHLSVRTISTNVKNKLFEYFPPVCVDDKERETVYLSCR